MLLCGVVQKNGCPGSWSHITEQFGMFSFTGLTGTCTGPLYMATFFRVTSSPPRVADWLCAVCGIAARHVRLLKSRYHIYMLDNGRYVQHDHSAT